MLTGEGLIRRIELFNGVFLVALTLGGWFFFSAKTAFSVFLGGALSSVSFQVLKWQLDKAFRDPTKIPSKGGLFVSYYLRILGMFFLVFVVMYYGWVDPIAFLVGLSVVVLSIFVVGGQQFLVMLLKKGES